MLIDVPFWKAVPQGRSNEWNQDYLPAVDDRRKLGGQCAGECLRGVLLAAVIVAYGAAYAEFLPVDG